MGKTLTIAFYPGNPPKLTLNGRKYPYGVGEFTSYIEGELKKGPETIVIGPVYSIGPTSAADPYSKAPYALKNRRGDIVDTAYSPQQLWNKHWDRVLGWGTHSRRAQTLKKATLLQRVVRVAQDHPETRASLIPVLRKYAANQPQARKIPKTEVSAWKSGLKRHKGKKGPLGLTFGQKYKHKGKDWLVYDFDADAKAPGGSTLVLVTPDFSETLRGVEHTAGKKTSDTQARKIPET